MPAGDPGGDGSAQRTVGVRVILSDPAVRVALLIVFVVMLGFGIIVPILPLYARSFGVDYRAASLLISSFAIARLVFDPVAGPIVDRYGERLASMAGVTVVGISSLLAGLAPTFTLAVVFRGAGGAGSSILFAALYSYLLKVVPGDRMARTLSLFFGALNIGIVAGGPLGGFIAYRFRLNTPLFVYAGLCFLAGVLYLRFLPNPPRRAEEGDPSGSPLPLWRRTLMQVSLLLRSRPFLTLMALNFTFFWVVAGGYDTLVPLFAAEALGVSTLGIGALFTVAVLAEFVVLYPAGSLADRVGRRPVAVASMAGLAVTISATGFAPTALALGVMMALLGVASGSAAASPGAMLSDVVPQGGSGTAVGVFRFAGDLGFVLGPLTAGATTQAFGFGVAFATMAAPAVLSLLLLARTPETLAPKREAAGEPPLRIPAVELSPFSEG